MQIPRRFEYNVFSTVFSMFSVVVLLPIAVAANPQVLRYSDVSRSEQLAAAQEHFKQADSNNDGEVTRVEMITVDRHDVVADLGWNWQQVLSQFDHSRDGALQESEYIVFISHMVAERFGLATQQDDVGPPEALQQSPAPSIRAPANELAAEAVDESINPTIMRYQQLWAPPGAVTGIIVPSAEGRPRVLSVAQMKESPVYNLEGNEIGEIGDVVASAEGDTGLVVEFGGFLGLWETQVFVPLASIYMVGEVFVWETLLSSDEIKESESFNYEEEKYTSLKTAEEELVGGL